MQLDELYKEVIMDHYRSPRNRGTLEEFTFSFELQNPTCGDVIQVQGLLDGDKIEKIAFTGEGCSISQASASMMTTLVKGKTVSEAKQIIERFLAMMRGEPGDYKDLKDLRALQGVSKYPVRIKCATLAWHVLEEGMKGR